MGNRLRVFAAAAVIISAAHADPVIGLKKTIAVDQFAAAEAVGGSVTADGLTALLIDALVRDGHFTVVERTGLATVQSEQALGTSGAVNAETSAKTGQLIGASALVRGAVIKYEAAAHGGSLSVGGAPLGGLLMPQAGVKRQTATLEISLRLIDTTTGQIVGTYNAKGSASANSAGATVVDPHTGLSVGADAFANTPIGQAAQDAIVKAVTLISDGMKKVPWSTTVVDASAEHIYISGGSDRNMTTGTDLVVWHKGKVLTDPTNGEVLDVELTRVCTLKIDSVRQKLSTAVLVDGTLPARGDIVKLP